MPQRRERPLPRLPISLDSLPPPESRRNRRLMLSFTESEFAMIERTARDRGEQPAVLCRTIVLTAFHNAAAQALAKEPDLLDFPPGERLRRVLDLFGDQEIGS
jgi:hypothetical protein